MASSGFPFQILVQKLFFQIAKGASFGRSFAQRKNSFFSPGFPLPSLMHLVLNYSFSSFSTAS